jgi:hypothetical protein
MRLAARGGARYLDRVFATPGVAAAAKFDVANVHIRARAADAGHQLALWRRYLERRGFRGPIWVTEHGYPSDPRYQTDPAYAYGVEAQADYLTRSVPALLAAGAEKVFVTERDNLAGAYASEGLLGGNVLDPPRPDAAPVRKPAFYAIRALAATDGFGRWSHDHTLGGFRGGPRESRVVGE